MKYLKGAVQALEAFKEKSKKARNAVGTLEAKVAVLRKSVADEQSRAGQITVYRRVLDQHQSSVANPVRALEARGDHTATDAGLNSCRLGPAMDQGAP